MAELEINLDLGPSMRKGMISGLADMIDALPQYRFAVILELLQRDTISRCLIGEGIGEEAMRVAAIEQQRQADYDAGVGDEPPAEEDWDTLTQRVLAELKDTPGGRGEV